MEYITNNMVTDGLETRDRMAAAGSLGALAVLALVFAAVTAPVATTVGVLAIAGAVAAKRWGFDRLRARGKTRERSRREGPEPVAAD